MAFDPNRIETFLIVMMENRLFHKMLLCDYGGRADVNRLTIPSGSRNTPKKQHDEAASRDGEMRTCLTRTQCPRL